MAHFREFRTIVVAIILAFICISEGSSKGKVVRRKQVRNENHLVNYLLETHNQAVRPIERPNDTILVSFGLSLLKIIGVDEEFRCITTYVMQTMEWNDWRLRWNPGEYNNISTISIPSHRVWTPDIVAYNNGRTTYYPAFQTNAVVRSNGTIKHVAPYNMVTCNCDIQTGKSELTCGLNFWSWTHSKSELNLFMQDEDGGDISKYIPSRDWEFLGIPGVRTEKRNAWLPQPYVDITYNLIIRRIDNSTDM